MSKFKVEIEEKLKRVIEQEAESLDDAVDLVEEKYHNCDIILDADDFIGEEIRARGEVSKDHSFYTSNGEAILLDGDTNLAIIKVLSNYDEFENFIVVSGLKFNDKNDIFEWNQGSHFKNILGAVLYYDELKNHMLEDEYYKQKNEIPGYRYKEICNELINEVFVAENHSEALKKLYDFGITKEEISILTTDSMEDIEYALEDNEEEEL